MRGIINPFDAGATTLLVERDEWPQRPLLVMLYSAGTFGQERRALRRVVRSAVVIFQDTTRSRYMQDGSMLPVGFHSISIGTLRDSLLAV